jgi:hypothetical protein
MVPCWRVFRAQRPIIDLGEDQVIVSDHERYGDIYRRAAGMQEKDAFNIGASVAILVYRSSPHSTAAFSIGAAKGR